MGGWPAGILSVRLCNGVCCWHQPSPAQLTADPTSPTHLPAGCPRWAMWCLLAPRSAAAPACRVPCTPWMSAGTSTPAPVTACATCGAASASRAGLAQTAPRYKPALPCWCPACLPACLPACTTLLTSPSNAHTHPTRACLFAGWLPPPTICLPVQVSRSGKGIPPWAIALIVVSSSALAGVLIVAAGYALQALGLAPRSPGRQGVRVGCVVRWVGGWEGGQL